MNSISFQYPSWYLFFCVLAGLGYALVLYFRDKTFKEQSAALVWGMGVLRFLAVTTICVLLMSPLLRSVDTQTQKPVIVLAQDASESVGASLTDEQKTAYAAEMAQLQAALSDKFEVKTYQFGDQVREGMDGEYKDKKTNITAALSEIYDVYSNQNLGGVVLATDGIYNEGSNPIYTGNKLAVPIYAVALGDTTPQRDLLLRRVSHNRIAYLGDKFTIQADIAARNCEGTTTNLTVSSIEDGTVRNLQQITIPINRADFFTTRELILDANRSGVQRYRLTLSQVAGEATTVNNVKDIFVDVLDARQKILLLANSPHPDLSALRQSILTNKNYQVEVAYAGSFSGNVADYDMVVLHQLPSTANDVTAILNNIKARRVPVLHIVGAQTSLPRLNQLQNLVRIRANAPTTNEVQGVVASGFSLFTIDDATQKAVASFPPLVAPFGDFDAVGGGQVMLYQRIGKIDTRYPLVILGEVDNVRTGVICAEGIWKWRLFDFLQNQNHALFDPMLGKVVQYVSLKEDKRRFRVNTDKNIFEENEAIVFDAELYNDSYELINEPDATIVVTDGDGKEYNFTFNKTERAYTLNAGILPVGSYRYKARTQSGGQALTVDGQLSVQPIQLELYEATADHGMLRLLSEQFGGALRYPGQLADIPALIAQTGYDKPVLYQTTQTRPLINTKWIFGLLLLLLSLEWFLRRYFGAY